MRPAAPHAAPKRTRHRLRLPARLAPIAVVDSKGRGQPVVTATPPAPPRLQAFGTLTFSSTMSGPWSASVILTSPLPAWPISPTHRVRSGSTCAKQLWPQDVSIRRMFRLMLLAALPALKPSSLLLAPAAPAPQRCPAPRH
jgi:hypothetical protein